MNLIDSPSNALFNLIAPPDSEFILSAVEELRWHINNNAGLKTVLPGIEVIPPNLVDEIALRATRRILIFTGLYSNNTHMVKNAGYTLYKTAFFAYVRALILAGVE